MVAFAAASAHATTIAQFTFDGSSLASSDTDPTSTASLALNGPSGISVENGNPLPGLIVSAPYTTGSQLFQSVIITLTPGAGFELNLSSLQFDASTSYFAPGIPSAELLVGIRSNLDGFATNLDTDSWSAGHQTPGFVSIVLDLSAAALQGLSAADLAGVGGSLQLKFFFAMTSCPPAKGVNGTIDNIVLTGTTVPEPAGLALLAMLAIAGLRARGAR